MSAKDQQLDVLKCAVVTNILDLKTQRIVADEKKLNDALDLINDRFDQVSICVAIIAPAVNMLIAIYKEMTANIAWNNALLDLGNRCINLMGALRYLVANIDTALLDTATYYLKQELLDLQNTLDALVRGESEATIILPTLKKLCHEGLIKELYAQMHILDVKHTNEAIPKEMQGLDQPSLHYGPLLRKQATVKLQEIIEAILNGATARCLVDSALGFELQIEDQHYNLSLLLEHADLTNFSLNIANLAHYPELLTSATTMLANSEFTETKFAQIKLSNPNLQNLTYSEARALNLYAENAGQMIDNFLRTKQLPIDKDNLLIQEDALRILLVSMLVVSGLNRIPSTPISSDAMLAQDHNIPMLMAIIADRIKAVEAYQRKQSYEDIGKLYEFLEHHPSQVTDLDGKDVRALALVKYQQEDKLALAPMPIQWVDVKMVDGAMYFSGYLVDVLKIKQDKLIVEQCNIKQNLENSLNDLTNLRLQIIADLASWQADSINAISSIWRDATIKLFNDWQKQLEQFDFFSAQPLMAVTNANFAQVKTNFINVLDRMLAQVTVARNIANTLSDEKILFLQEFSAALQLLLKDEAALEQQQLQEILDQVRGLLQTSVVKNADLIALADKIQQVLLTANDDVDMVLNLALEKMNKLEPAIAVHPSATDLQATIERSKGNSPGWVSSGFNKRNIEESNNPNYQVKA